jgi:hypothetical protein
MGGSALWDDYGYHHDDLVEPDSLVPVRVPRPRSTGDPCIEQASPTEHGDFCTDRPGDGSGTGA